MSLLIRFSPTKIYKGLSFNLKMIDVDTEDHSVPAASRRENEQHKGSNIIERMISPKPDTLSNRCMAI